MKYIIGLTLLLFAVQSAIGQLSFSKPGQNPVELGQVNWHRNYDEALSLAAKQDKPVFILFQEVPGCATCRNFGSDVLSHPFVVEMIETHFVPLAIFNNVKGHDREVLNKFKEPTWNNPVVRVIDKREKDIVNRLGNQWTELAVSHTITNALGKIGKDAPKYFQLYQEELIGRSGKVAEANLAMYCFWTGEKELAKMEGILSTEPGYMNGHEVVKIEYNPYVTSLEKILPEANKVKCADEVYVDEKINVGIPVKATSNYRKDREDKYYLLHTTFNVVPMTPLQAAKVNSAIGNKMNPEHLLSPRQLELHQSLNKQNRGSSIGKSFQTEWYKLIN